MEQPQELVSEVKKEVKKTSFQYVIQEIENDISVFPTEAQEVIRRWLDGTTLKANEQGLMDKSINQWWQNKYGFPYVNKVARTEVIMRKYSSPTAQEEIANMHTLQEKLLAAFISKDGEEIGRLKAEYYEKFPDQLEGVEIIFGLENYLNDQAIVDSYKEEHKSFADIRDKFQSLTEYNFLLTHFIHNNRNDKEFLQKMWAVLEEIAKNRSGRDLDRFHMLQRGTVTQVATQRLFEEAGFRPRISHPAEDAFHAIDLWTDTAAIQIKGDNNKKADIVFLETDTIAFPGIEATKEEAKEQAETYHINSYMFQGAQKFHAKLSQYREFMQKDVKGYFLIVPHHKIDFVTGEPSDDMIQLVKERVQTELK